MQFERVREEEWKEMAKRQRNFFDIIIIKCNALSGCNFFSFTCIHHRFVSVSDDREVQVYIFSLYFENIISIFEWNFKDILAKKWKIRDVAASANVIVWNGNMQLQPPALFFILVSFFFLPTHICMCCSSFNELYNNFFYFLVEHKKKCNKQHKREVPCILWSLILLS
jgi:hypothetical protein